MKVLILICLAALRAAAQSVDVELDQAANFGKYHTFAIREGQLNSRNPALNNELIRQRIEADIERGLSARGLTRGARVVRLSYTEGTLVIDLCDPTTRIARLERNRSRRQSSMRWS